MCCRAYSRFFKMIIIALVLAWTMPTPGAEPATDVQDPGWPRVFEKEGQKVAVYQPQVDTWDDYRKITFRAAVAVSLKDQEKPAYGVIEVQADTKVDPDTRMVLMDNPKREIRFPSLAPAEGAKLEATVREALPNRQSLEISLDRVLAYMETDEVAQRSVQVDLNPPVIFFSDKPAILINFRGEPKFKPVPDTGLMFAVNANWDMLMDPTGGKYYLLNKESWLIGADPLKGPWQAATQLPGAFGKLPATDDWKDLRAAIPGKLASQVPVIFASTKPAEIIITDGEPQYSAIADTQLMAVSNTESPLFLCNTDGNHYFLVAGRWFRAKTLQGPWEAATTSLPKDFAKIPADDPRSFALASVPGTDVAEDAVLLASVPHMATINRSSATLQVDYQGGQPQFATIKGTSVKSAVNTSEDVFEVAGVYYCCHEGVWFTSASPEGPWTVCDKVPDEIYTIPADNPQHNVTYVNIYESSPETVDVGYTGGYMGQYVDDGVLMYGAGLATGYALADEWYDDWHDDWDDYYDYQYDRPAFSYGCGAVYNPYYGGYYAGYGAMVGRYGSAAYAYGPYRGAARMAYYNPATGAYSRGAYRYGTAGSAHARAAFNPWTDTAGARIGGSNVYGSWGRSVAKRGDDWAADGHRSTPQGTTGWVRTSADSGFIGTTRGEGGFAAKTKGDDIYAGHDGNVYRRDNGDWQKWDNGGWNDTNRPASQTRPGTAGNQGIAQRSDRPGARGGGEAAQLPARPGAGTAQRPAQLPAGSGVSGGARPVQRPAGAGQTRDMRSGATASRPASSTAQRGGANPVRNDLNYNYQARQAGNVRSNEYQRARTSSRPQNTYRPTTKYSRPSSSSNRSSYSRPSSSKSRTSYHHPSSSRSSRPSTSRSSPSRSSGSRGGGGGGRRR